MKSFCIIGLGKFGMTLAETLAKDGKQVLVIDADESKINYLADIVTNAVIGDPTNENVLKAAGITDYDCAVICFANNVNDNVLLTIMLKELGIKKVVARALNEGHQKVLERIGVDSIVFPEKDMGEKLAYLLGRENVTEFIDFHGYQIVEIRVPHVWEGKSLIELDIRRKFGVNVLAITDRDGKVIVSPSPSRVFGADEKMSVMGTARDVERLTKQIS